MYLLLRIKESNGFVAKRCLKKALLLATAIYGSAATENGRVLTPNMMYNEILDDLSWKEAI